MLLHLDRLFDEGGRSAELYRKRGLAHASLGRDADAIADFTWAIELGAQDAETWLLRGGARARLGSYEEARTDFARAVEIDADDYEAWAYQAQTCLAVGNATAAQKVCAAMRQRFAVAEGQPVLEKLLWTSLLVPGAVSDYAALLPQAEKSVPNAVGAVLFRSGRPSEAIPKLEATLQKMATDLPNAFFLAMAHHRAGHAEQARLSLAKAIEATEEVMKEKPSGVFGPALWEPQLAAHLLRREAEALINPKPAPAKP
jgi:tetratricopeptide (TPR) repeat protein